MEREPNLVKVLTTTIEHLKHEAEEVRARANEEIKKLDDMIHNCERMIVDSKRRSEKLLPK